MSEKNAAGAAPTWLTDTRTSYDIDASGYERRALREKVAAITPLKVA